MPELIFQTADPWLIVRFQGAALMDSHLIARASAELSERLRQLPPRPKVLLNFRGIEFVSSQVLGLLLTARTQVGTLRGTLVLCRVSPKIREALHIAGLTKQFTIEESETAVVGERKAAEKPKGPNDVGWLD